MSNLKIHPSTDNGRIVHVTPQSAGWTYVGFDLWKLKPGEDASGGEGLPPAQDTKKIRVE